MGRVGCLVCRRCGPGTGGCLGLVVFVRLLVDEAVQFRHSGGRGEKQDGKERGFETLHEHAQAWRMRELLMRHLSRFLHYLPAPNPARRSR